MVSTASLVKNNTETKESLISTSFRLVLLSLTIDAETNKQLNNQNSCGHGWQNYSNE